jgi:hypothetical protein
MHVNGKPLWMACTRLTGFVRPTSALPEASAVSACEPLPKFNIVASSPARVKNPPSAA